MYILFYGPSLHCIKGVAPVMIYSIILAHNGSLYCNSYRRPRVPFCEMIEAHQESLVLSLSKTSDSPGVGVHDPGIEIRQVQAFLWCTCQSKVYTDAYDHL